jgi:N-carbamoyl-L-amino-acid hydrolase
LEDELARIGYKGTAPCRKFPVHCYYEFHIEQGPMLERRKKLIGAPKGILCLHWYDITLTGEANQVGPTPMEGRHDALVAAAEMILKVRQLPGAWEANGGHRGEIQTIPTPISSGPRALYRDIRSRDDDLALRSWDLLRRISRISRHARLPDHDRGDRRHHSPSTKNRSSVCWIWPTNWATPTCSGSAAPDTTPATLTTSAHRDDFVPSIGGCSHVEIENTRWEDCARAATCCCTSSKAAMEK